MDRAELIIKAYYYSEPQAKKLRSRTSIMELVLILHGWEKVADLGISGVVIYSSPDGTKHLNVRRW